MGQLLALNFTLSENVVDRKMSSKMQNVELKNPYFGKFKAKIKILTTHNLRC